MAVLRASAQPPQTRHGRRRRPRKRQWWHSEAAPRRWRAWRPAPTLSASCGRRQRGGGARRQGGRRRRRGGGQEVVGGRRLDGGGDLVGGRPPVAAALAARVDHPGAVVARRRTHRLRRRGGRRRRREGRRRHRDGAGNGLPDQHNGRRTGAPGRGRDGAGGPDTGWRPGGPGDAALGRRQGRGNCGGGGGKTARSKTRALTQQ